MYSDDDIYSVSNDYETYSEDENYINHMTDVQDSIREQEDLDTFLECLEEARGYFYFLKWKSSGELYYMIKNNIYDKTVEEIQMTDGDYYWCSNLISSANPEYEITDNIVFQFYMNII
jgi:hypothetical protein